LKKKIYIAKAEISFLLFRELMMVLGQLYVF